MLWVLIPIIVAVAVLFAYRVKYNQSYVTCTFDRNEIGPKGDHGQWYWEFYKCEDGTERRILVASPRG